VVGGGSVPAPCPAISVGVWHGVRNEGISMPAREAGLRERHSGKRNMPASLPVLCGKDR